MLPSHLLSGAAGFFRKRHVGLPPGSVVFVGNEKTTDIHFSVLDYTGDNLLESLRDVAGGLTDLYVTALSDRMNETMTVLTITGTIFIPLTFTAGIYGMNFEYMPELTVWYAYPVAMTVMIAIAGALLIYFWCKNWIWSAPSF